MTKDLNKGISQIQYNSLNLPVLLDIKSPVGEGRNEYTYTASGVKLRVTHRWNPGYSTTPVIGSAINENALTVTEITEYVGNKVYTDGKLKVLVDGGYIEDNKYHYYIKDHLGNNRIVVDQYNNQIQSSQYYPFGMTMAESTGQEKQPYKYNGKEMDKKHGLDWYDYSARHLAMDIPRFTTVDPMAEKYYSISPYVYVANNPMKYIDLRGDSISVAEEYRELFYVGLASAFGNHAKDFDYTESGMLVYKGTTEGMSKDQKKLLKGMSSVMNETIITNVVYGETTEITLSDGSTSTVAASQGGGALAVLASENEGITQNTLLIDPSLHHKTLNVMEVTSAYYNSSIGNNPRFKQSTFRTNIQDLFFHELGHVIYQGQSQDKVLNYNNIFRKIIGLPKRKPDETHNKTIK